MAIPFGRKVPEGVFLQVRSMSPLTAMEAAVFDDVIKERFWSKVDQSAGPDGCWPWTGVKNKGGYGVFSAMYRPWAAHRVALALHTQRFDLFQIKGITSGVGNLARHSCDNRPCCNPAHLQWGTPEQNARDVSPEKRLAATEKAKATIARTGIMGGCRNRQEWLLAVERNKHIPSRAEMVK